jgi:hypothetical protein
VYAATREDRWVDHRPVFGPHDGKPGKIISSSINIEGRHKIQQARLDLGEIAGLLYLFTAIVRSCLGDNRQGLFHNRLYEHTVKKHFKFSVVSIAVSLFMANQAGAANTWTEARSDAMGGTGVAAGSYGSGC